MTELATNVLYYGDNLDILRRYLPDASVDLVYLEPPFNSNRDYNIIFKNESGMTSTAQNAGRVPSAVSLAIDGEVVHTNSELQRAIRRHPIGQAMPVQVVRSGETGEIGVARISD